AISVEDLRMSYERGRARDQLRRRGRGSVRIPGPERRRQDDHDREGYRKRTKGDVSVLGTDPGRPTREWRERIGLVLQECELDPTLTVREIVTLFSRFYRSPRPVDETIDLVGLAEERDARVGTLSGGQRRRVDVA